MMICSYCGGDLANTDKFGPCRCPYVWKTVSGEILRIGDMTIGQLKSAISYIEYKHPERLEEAKKTYLAYYQDGLLASYDNEQADYILDELEDLGQDPGYFVVQYHLLKEELLDRQETP